MEKNLYDKYYYGKSVSSSNKKTTIVGIIDASGSMSSCWSTLVENWNKIVDENLSMIYTITFSTSASLIEEKHLNVKMVGGGTNICSGFQLAIETIININNSNGEKDFTIIFVSDGDDGDMKTIEKRIRELSSSLNFNINLISVGIGSGFPTFVAMNLREKFHNGLSTIPAVFLVNDFKTEIESNFVSIKNRYVKKLELVKISPSVRIFPWSTQKEEMIYEEAFFISDTNIVNINGQEIILKTNLSKFDLEEIFRAWTQELQLQSINNSVRKEANESVIVMENMLENYMSFEPVQNPKTILERIELKEKNSGIHKLKSLVSECKRIRDGVSLKDLTPEEAAKRLAIGTQVGKYHNKALQMRGLNADEYETLRDEFIKKLQETKLNPESKQEASFILLQNQKEVLLEDSIISAISNLNQYLLVEVFPLVGHTLFIHRSASSMINPFTINVISIPRINKVCDTVSLVSQGNEMEISIGNDEEEKFNAVIPLYSTFDEDLKPLIRSKLYHLLMTFNCMRNVDTLYTDAYYGLLANTFLRLIKYQESSWRTEMINLIYTTFEIVYGGINYIEESLNLLLNKPRDALITEHKDIKHKCEDVSKAILNLLVLSKRGKISPDKCKETIEYIIIEHIGRSLKEGIDLYEEINGEEEFEDYYLKQSKDNFQSNKEDVKNDKDIDSVTLQENIIPIKEAPEIIVDINMQISDNVVNSQIISGDKELDEVKNSYISSKKYLAFDNIKDLKSDIKKLFNEFSSKLENSVNKNIRINQNTFNKKAYRINFSFFYDLNKYFSCEPLNEKIFWIALNHSLKFSSSYDRNTIIIDTDYSKIREKRRLEYYRNISKKLKEQNYEKFEKIIVDSFLSETSNSLKLIKDFHLTTELIKNKANIDNINNNVNVILFGPFSMGKSSVVGRILYDLGFIDLNLFSNYATAYSVYNHKSNLPFEWLSNMAADERCKNKTIYVNVTQVPTKNNFITIYDTPGSYKLFKRSISTMALVDHFFLCVEANISKFNEEKLFIQKILAYSYAYKCTNLNVIVTKIELCDNLDVIMELLIKEFNELISKNKINMSLRFIPLSSHSGINIIKKDFSDYPSLYETIDSMTPRKKLETNSNQILVLDKINDKFDKKVVYGYVFGEIRKNDKFISFPSMLSGIIKNINVNYTNVENVSDRQLVSFELNENSDNLKINNGSLLKIYSKLPKYENKARINNMNVNFKYIGYNILKCGSCINICFGYYLETFQIKDIISVSDSMKNELEKDKISNNNIVDAILVPVTINCYVEDIFDNMDFVIRGPHYKLYGLGKITNIDYNFKL